jgi:hypothetical protein
LAAGGALGKGDAAAGVFVEEHFAADCVRATIAAIATIKSGGALDGFGLCFAGESLLAFKNFVRFSDWRLLYW